MDFPDRRLHYGYLGAALAHCHFDPKLRIEPLYQYDEQTGWGAELLHTELQRTSWDLVQVNHDRHAFSYTQCFCEPSVNL